MFTRDEYGILGQIQHDGTVEGGDSVNWMGHLLYLKNDKLENPNSVVIDSSDFVSFFERSPGAYVRHPMINNTYFGFGAHYKGPWDGCISRDQLTGILGALIIGKQYSALIRLIIHHMAWGMLFAYNTIHNGTDPATAKWKWPDLTVFDIWATELRGFGVVSYLFYPILCVFDLHLLMSVLHTNRQPLSMNDVISHTLKLLIAKEHVPTPVSMLAWALCDKKSLTDKLRLYWTGWRQQLGMFMLYKNKLEG